MTEQVAAAYVVEPLDGLILSIVVLFLGIFMTRRIPVLHRAVPHAYVEFHPNDASRLGIRDGQQVRLVTRRGSLELPSSIDGRGRPAEGQVFVPFFDESMLINELTLDAFCPISKKPDYKKCAVRVEVV